MNEITQDADDLELPTIEDFIDNGKYPSDDDAPTDMQPKKRRRSSKRQREVIEAVSAQIAMLNGMFAMMVPCGCAATLPEELRGIAHRENCVKLYPLDEQETATLAKAIGAEFEAHPDWVDKLEHAETWVAHATLAAAIFGIVASRRMRSERIMLPDDAPPELVRLASVNGIHADTV